MGGGEGLEVMDIRDRIELRRRFILGLDSQLGSDSKEVWMAP